MRWMRTMLPAVFVAVILVPAGLALGQDAGSPEPRTNREEIVTLEGTVTKSQGPFATVESGGDNYILYLGPVCTQEARGYSLATGDRITVTGELFVYGKTRHLDPHTLVVGGTTHVLADEAGVPAWGRGGRGWNGPGGRGYRGGYGRMHHAGCADCPRHPGCGDCPHGHCY